MTSIPPAMANKTFNIVPRYTASQRQSYCEFPLGLAYVSACLKQAGNAVDEFNLNHEQVRKVFGV